MRWLNRKFLERLKAPRRLGADVTGLRQSRGNCAWSSAGKEGKWGYVKLHSLFDLESKTV